MKQLFLFLTILFIICSVEVPFSYAKALTPTVALTPVTASPSGSATIDAQINSLKDKIASRVAQLKLVEKRGIVGTVTESTNSQITLTDLRGNVRYIDVDELTKFNNPGTKGTFGISDMSKGTVISVLGLYNKEDRRVLARFVDVVSYPKVIVGVAQSIDKPNYLIHVASADQKDNPVDIEAFTKTYVYTKSGDIQRAGFSKLKEGERVTIIGFPDKNNKTHILANRIIAFPELLANPKISGPTPSATASSSATPAASTKLSPTSVKSK